MTELKFRKSSYSGQDQNCVEVASVLPDLRKSSYSRQEPNCVEVAPLPAPGAAVRDSKHPGAGYLAFPATEWEAFLATARRGAL